MASVDDVPAFRTGDQPIDQESKLLNSTLESELGKCRLAGMGTISTNNSLSSYLQTLENGLQVDGATNQQTTNTTSSLLTPSTASTSDGGQLSPLAQVVSVLQNLQESNPTEYAQIIGQIAANLQSAAQTAKASGNTAVSQDLTQLASAFTTASQTGQLPQFQNQSQDSNQGSGQHAHGHHHHHGGDMSSTSTSSGTATATGASSATDSAFSSTATANSTNPISIIFNTLQNAGLLSA